MVDPHSQQGSKRISWQTERTLHLPWSTAVVYYLKTYSTRHGIFDLQYKCGSTNMNSAKSNQRQRFFNQKRFSCSVVIHRDDVLPSMSISNLPTCVVHQIFTTITQSICPYRILLGTTACTK